MAVVSPPGSPVPLERGLDAAQGRGHAGGAGVAGGRVVLEQRAAAERAGEAPGVEVGQEAPVGEAVDTRGGGIGVGHRPPDVVMATDVGDPGRQRGRAAAARERPLGQPDITGGQARPEHHHELVVVGQVALRAEPVMAAEVLGQHLRADDRLGLQHQAGRGQPGQRPERLQQQVSLGLVLAVGAHPLPQERHRVEPQYVDAPVGQGEHGAQHGPEHRRVGVVQVPLVLVEARPYPAQAAYLGEAARSGVGKHLGQRALVSVGLGAVRVDQVHLAVTGLAGERLTGPFVLPRGVVEHQVDAQGHAALVQVARQRLQVGHGADPRVHLVVVGHRVAAVALPVARPQQRHQVQVGDAQLRQVVQVLADPGQRAGEPVGVADVADHAGALEPGRVDLPAAVEPPQARRARGGRVQRVEHQPGRELGDVRHAAVELAERPGDVEGQGLEPRQERVGLHWA